MPDSARNMRSARAGERGARIWIVGMAVLFSLAQWSLATRALGVGSAASIAAARQVVQGTPAWRVVQSRVLGPYMVNALTVLIPDYATAYALFFRLCLAGAGVLAYYTGYLVNRRAGGLVGFFLFQSLFAVCLDANWLYVWDAVDLVVFYAFFVMVIRGASWRWGALLFAVAVFNRESALFIALWLLLDPLCRWVLGRLERAPSRILDVASMAAGAICLLVGVVMIEALRTGLLVEELGTKNGIPSIYGAHAFLTFWANLDPTIRAFSFADSTVSILPPVFVVVIVALLLRMAAARPSMFMGAALVGLIQIVATVMVGLIYETRIFLAFIPFVGVATVTLMAAGETVPPAADKAVAGIR